MVDPPPVGLVLFLENKSGEIGTISIPLSAEFAGTVMTTLTYGSQKKDRIEGGLSNVDCESRSRRGKLARAPLDRLSPLLPRETTLLGDDFAFPAAALHALLDDLAALGVAAR